MITSEYLGSANNIGCHQIARQLAKMGVKTFVVSFPISPLYKLISTKTDYSTRKKFSKKFVEVDKNLFSYIPNTLIPPIPQVIQLLPIYLKIWEFLAKKTANILPDTKFDFVFCESLFFPRLLQKISYKKLVVRLPDNFSGFWKGNNTLISAEKNLLKSADIIASPSTLKVKELNNEYKQKRIIHLDNGVDVALYKKIYSKPALYQNSPFNAVYVGAISTWFDMDMLFKIANLKPNWQFTIIGKAPKISAPSNIKFVGEKKDNNKIPYLQHANVGIIPFETEINKSLINYVNPIKMYEYLASGIPVISTEWVELSLINAPIMLAKNADDFAEYLSKLETTTVLKAPLIEFAAKFDWRAITEQLLTEISNEKH